MENILEIVFGDKSKPVFKTFNNLFVNFYKHPETYFEFALFVILLTIIDNGRTKLLFQHIKKVFVLPKWFKIIYLTYNNIQNILNSILKILASSGFINFPFLFISAHFEQNTSRILFAKLFLTSLYLFYFLLWIKICLINLSKPITIFKLNILFKKFFNIKQHYIQLILLWRKTEKYLITYFIVTFPLLLVFSFPKKQEIISKYTVFGYLVLLIAYLLSFNRIHRKNIDNY